MIYFFDNKQGTIQVVESAQTLNSDTISKLSWLFSGSQCITQKNIEGTFIGPRKEMITPWSTNAVEITQNIGIVGITRIEEFKQVADAETTAYDSMLFRKYNGLDETIFTINKTPEPIQFINNIAEYNEQEGLALNAEEIDYLIDLSKRLGRLLTDSEIFGFSQVNSEHCRHKIFNGTFIIDEQEKPFSLFKLIRQTTESNPNRVVSAYKDNCAFIDASKITHFAPKTHNKPDFFTITDFDSIISIKAETHNFPTTVEPLNGAATGSGGEIRDRMAGGKASFPIAGTAVYMTSYTRLQGANRIWEHATQERPWLYQTPKDILIKASNGASDFGNKFGQPLICGSVLTFEHSEHNKDYGYDKVIMLAGGVGFAKKSDAFKDTPQIGDKVILLGGDNYRIGMGGGAVSSVATGEFTNAIELNAVQRSNPEMQKRVYNTVRALGEMDVNPVVSIHDHGAGGHLNCLSELVEETGGIINIDELPIGDPSLSAKEIVGNESQERIGLIVHESDIETLAQIAEREHAPMYVIGETTGTHQFTFINNKTNEKPIDLQLIDMFGNSPKTIMQDTTINETYKPIQYDDTKIYDYIEQVLQLEAVACKDYLTNKVDRSVTGRVATQQCCGELQLPLNNCGVVALDFIGNRGIATSLGHAPAAGIISAKNGSILSIAESLTNIVCTPIEGGLQGISLSANWIWPCKNPGEDARLYEAVEAASVFAQALKINIPTGKDSLSMTQKYKDGKMVFSPGTVIITACGEVQDIRQTVEPVLQPISDSVIAYVDFGKSGFPLGGSAFAQIVHTLGTETPTVTDSSYFAKTFGAIQECVRKNSLFAAHDVSAGGLLTALLEMNFANTQNGMDIDIRSFKETSITKILFSENPALIIQTTEQTITELIQQGVSVTKLGKVQTAHTLSITTAEEKLEFDIAKMRKTWFTTSFLLDKEQSGVLKATERFEHFDKIPLEFTFPKNFNGQLSSYNINTLKRTTKSGVTAAIIREKGISGDREMAWCMHLAGFDVKDVHMTDLISGRENLEDVQFIVFVGGASNSNVLGPAKGWAGAFLYNPKAKQALDAFYARKNTMSLGVSNGCQLMVELGLLWNDDENKAYIHHNDSHKFESAFLSVTIPQSNSIMLQSLVGTKLGTWVAHEEGKLKIAKTQNTETIALTYSHSSYPANPNGSDNDIAGICSQDGRHVAMMPHLERALYPWNWAYYPKNAQSHEVSPWIEAFIHAKNWIQKHQ